MILLAILAFLQFILMNFALEIPSEYAATKGQIRRRGTFLPKGGRGEEGSKNKDVLCAFMWDALANLRDF